MEYSMEQRTKQNLENSELRDLYPVLENTISLRLGLRSSGKICKEDRPSLLKLLDDLYKFDKKELIKVIDFQSEEYKREKNA